MKKRSNIYLILTYLFFIYPPFIWGFVLIYKESFSKNEHVISLLINVILLIVIATLCFLSIRREKLHIPNDREIRHLIFGFVGNIVVYFYTFQNIMKIDNYVTIYLVLLIVLGFHYFLISKKFGAKELWILMPIFLVIDFVHILVSGCGFTEGSLCHRATAFEPFLTVLYSIMILASLGYYAYRVYLLKQNDSMKYANIVLVTFLSVFIQDTDFVDEKIMLTVGILLPLFTIIDFIISIVNKKYSHKMLFFYLRMYTILLIATIAGVTDFFSGTASYEILTMMVTVTYISLFITIFGSLLKIDNKEVRVNKDVLIDFCNTSHIVEITKEYGEIKASKMSLEDDSYSLVALKNEDIVGFVSISRKSLTAPLGDIEEAFINIIEVKDEFRRTGIATKLIEKTEKHFKSKKVSQLRGWGNQDEVEAIQLWNKLQFSLVPALIQPNDQNLNVNGYYFVKKI